ncbi:hypothetical protein ACK9YZ_11940 [Rhizobium sp. ZK1]|uniref:hypothetical protein n=1 Tax=Rhizobium sp. ZK1 TaxID=3389872 RepID=UPI0039F73B19
MDNMQPYDDWKRRQQGAAAASYIQSSDENPDEVADNLNFARQYSERTGNPLPTLSMIREYRPTFQRIMDETRDKALLSTARKTATWYGENPMAILLAKDDVYNLCSFEEAVQRYGQLPKAFGDATLPAKEPAGSSANPEAPPSASPAGPAAPQQAPALGPVAPSSQPGTPAPENAGSTPQPGSPPVDPAGSNASSPDRLEEPAQPAAPVTENVAPDTQPAVSPPSLVSDPLVAEDTRSDDTRKSDALIEEIANAGKSNDEQAAVLEEKIRTQDLVNPGAAKFYLDAVRAHEITPDQVRVYLASSSSPIVKRTKEVGQTAIEAPKGITTGLVTAVGRIMEGDGQLMSSPPSPEAEAVIEVIANAAKAPADQIPLIKQQIANQDLIEKLRANIVLEEVLAGRMTPEQARRDFDPWFADFFKTIQDWGATIGDFGETIAPAAPGYENNWVRRGSEMLGAYLPALVVASKLGPGGAIAIEMMRAAGEGTAAARKAKASEYKQSQMAVAFAPTAFTDLLPTAKILSPILNRVIMNQFLRHLVGHVVQDGTAQTIQQVIQNAIKRQLLDPSQEVFKDIGVTFAGGSLASVGKEFLILGVKALLRNRGSSHTSTPHPEAAAQTRQSLEEISVAAQASKLWQRSRDEFHKFATRMTPNPEARDVFVPAGAFVRAAKAAGINPEDLVDSRTLAFARITGGDVKLSMATYATHFAGSKGDGYIMDNIRPHASSLTFAESQAFREHANAYGSTLNPRASPAFSSPIIDRAAEQRAYNLAVLRSAIAGHPAETISHFAISHSAFTSALAGAEGRSLDEYLKLYPQP